MLVEGTLGVTPGAMEAVEEEEVMVVVEDVEEVVMAAEVVEGVAEKGAVCGYVLCLSFWVN